ncbi:MAG TPA: hypothetical protein VFG76_05185 [Candidatus Polarisedimenticolia bacterium]|nr:hypothetical protein [Candidatus Polarisedimenticolia bacterium]
MVRQGDVLLMAVPDDGRQGKQLPRDRGRLVLAYGEVTGHAHAVATKDAEMFSVKDQTFLRMIERGELTHEEHGTIPLDRGLYRVIRQSEYAPEEIRQVAD